MGGRFGGKQRSAFSAAERTMSGVESSVDMTSKRRWRPREREREMSFRSRLLLLSMQAMHISNGSRCMMVAGQMGAWSMEADLVTFATAIAAVEKCSRLR